MYSWLACGCILCQYTTRTSLTCCCCCCWFGPQAWHRQRHPQQFITSAAPAASSQQAQTQPAWLLTQQLHLLLLVTVASASLTLTAFYWAAVYVKGEYLRFDNPIKHGASAFLLLVELLVSRTPLVSYHVQVRAGRHQE
jgi:hypothetical protein